MSKQRVVIVGGGFAGAFSAKYLRKYLSKDVDIELINKDNYFVFQPLLPEVASGTINAQDAVTPLRGMLPGVKFRMGEVISIDKQNQTVQVLQGSYRKSHHLPYDHLILAMGQETNLTHSPGFAEHSLCMRNLADAHQLRNKIIRRLEHADITEDAALKAKLLTFVVAGGGFSGVETIGEVAEMIERALRFYPNIDSQAIQCVLIQRSDRILPELPERLGEYALKKLTARNIHIRCNCSIVSATGHAVYLDDGTVIPTSLLVTTVGNGPTPFLQQLGFDLERGKLPVTPHLNVLGHKNIWALGDAALIPLVADEKPTEFAPPTAQYAVREANCVASNIKRALGNKDLLQFKFTPRGSLASIGNYKGVAEVFGVRCSGLLAWMMWRFLYIGMLPGFSTRLRVALNWGFDYVLPRSIVQIKNQRKQTSDFRVYKAGDTVISAGERVDGFYAIISGALETRTKSDGEDFVRNLGPGDHWGERSANTDAATVSTVTAVEDSRVMVVDRREFQNMRMAFPPLEEYFSSINDKIYPEKPGEN